MIALRIFGPIHRMETIGYDSNSKSVQNEGKEELESKKLENILQLDESLHFTCSS